MRRWYVLGMAAAVALQVAACAPPSPQEQAKEQVQESIDQAKESVGGTVEAKVEEVKATAETAKDTAGDVTAGLADWGKAVATALGQMGVQASALKSDPTQMADEDWTSTTKDTITEIQKLAEEATTASDQLLAEDKMPNLQAALATMGTELAALATKSGDAVSAGDADAFLAETEGLQKAMTALGALQLLIDQLK